MGNWMTVNITGTCAESEVEALRQALFCDDDYENFHPLCHTARGSICGLGDWSGEIISAIGNVAERDYTAQDIAETLTEIIRTVPSLSLKVHCGGDYESKECIATVVVNNGTVEVREPEIKELMAISTVQMKQALMKCLGIKH